MVVVERVGDGVGVGVAPMMPFCFFFNVHDIQYGIIINRNAGSGLDFLFFRKGALCTSMVSWVWRLFHLLLSC